MPPSAEEEGFSADDETNALRASAPFCDRPLPGGFVGLIGFDDPADQRVAHHVLAR